MTQPQPTVRLSQDQIDFYHREGYLVIQSISTPDELARLREIYDRLFAQRAGRENGDQFDLGGTDEDGKPNNLPQILSPAKYAPELLHGLFRVNALAIAKQLLGPQTDARGEHAIFKPARVGSPTPWHQDEAYWDPGWNYISFSLWMPLQEATLENGCMQFIPRSHKLEVQPHHSIGHDPRVHGLEIDHIDASTAVACPIPAGGCTIHHQRTMHYAGPNTSDIPRRAYILGFGLPGSKRDDVRDFYWNAKKKTAREERAKLAGAGKQPGV